MDGRRVLKLLLACLALPLPLAAQAGQAVKRVWVSRSGSVTKVSLELTGPVAAKHFSLAAPSRLVLDLPQASLQASLNDLALDGTAVTAVRSGITASGDLRIVLDLADSAVRGEVRSLNTGRHGLELVLSEPPVGVAPEVAKPLARQRDLLIVVDAGHGGKDPGAVGPKGEQEKHVALQIAKLLAKRIDAQKGYKARLVRSDDVFIPLRKRAELAQRMNADLFVSVHADAAPRLTASGASVFALSQGGATPWSPACCWICR